MTFKVHNIDDAPEQARHTLKVLEERYGFLPNFMGVLAESPALLNGYLALEAQVKKTSLSPVERNVVMLTISADHGSGYCMAVHSKDAEKEDVPIEVLDDLRAGSPVDDPKLEALRLYTKGVMKNHGRPSDEVKEKFLAAGYGPQQALEIILIIAMKTISNYTNKIAHTPLDDAFKETAWTQDEAA